MGQQRPREWLEPLDSDGEMMEVGWRTVRRKWPKKERGRFDYIMRFGQTWGVRH
jgi:hypothetical protein